MSQPNIMICAPADTPFTEAGSTFKYVCSECTRHVQVSPAGESRLRSIEEIKIVCDECYKPGHEEAGVIAVPIRAPMVPNFWRNRN